MNIIVLKQCVYMYNMSKPAQSNNTNIIFIWHTVIHQGQVYKILKYLT